MEHVHVITCTILKIRDIDFRLLLTKKRTHFLMRQTHHQCRKGTLLWKCSPYIKHIYLFFFLLPSNTCSHTQSKQAGESIFFFFSIQHILIPMCEPAEKFKRRFCAAKKKENCEKNSLVCLSHESVGVSHMCI